MLLCNSIVKLWLTEILELFTSINYTDFFFFWRLECASASRAGKPDVLQLLVFDAMKYVMVRNWIILSQGTLPPPFSLPSVSPNGLRRFTLVLGRSHDDCRRYTIYLGVTSAHFAKIPIMQVADFAKWGIVLLVFFMLCPFDIFHYPCVCSKCDCKR